MRTRSYCVKLVKHFLFTVGEDMMNWLVTVTVIANIHIPSF